MVLHFFFFLQIEIITEKACSSLQIKNRLPRFVNVICEGREVDLIRNCRSRQLENKQSENITFKNIYFTCWSAHVAERSPTIRRIWSIMCENHPSSFCSNQERQTGFSARGGKKKIRCHRLQASAVQVRHRQEKAPHSWENYLNIYQINLKIIVVVFLIHRPLDLLILFLFFKWGWDLPRTGDIFLSVAGGGIWVTDV